jgi:hypothetical protein
MVPKVSKVLSQSRHRFRERDLTTTCKQCGQERNLADCPTNADAEVRTYRCFKCGDLLLLVGHPSDRSISGERYRAGTWWSVRPTRDLFVQLRKNRLRIPAAPGAPIFGRPLL